MLSTTNLDIVRRTYDVWANAGVSADVQRYVRSEYNGDATFVLGEIARARRETRAPSPARTGLRYLVALLAARIGSARRARNETSAEATG